MKYRNELRKWRIRGMRRQQWRTGFELCARQILCICDRVYLKLATMSTNHWTQLGLWQSWLCLLHIYHHPPFIHPLNKLSQCKSVIGMVAWSVVLSRSFYRDSIHPPMGHGQTERQADRETGSAVGKCKAYCWFSLFSNWFCSSFWTTLCPTLNVTNSEGR